MSRGGRNERRMKARECDEDMEGDMDRDSDKSFSRDRDQCIRRRRRRCGFCRFFRPHHRHCRFCFIRCRCRRCL